MQRKVPFMKRKVHTLSWLAHGISPIVFDPMVLVHGIASKSVDLVGNNTERGGESVLSNYFQYSFQIYTLIYSSDIDH